MTVSPAKLAANRRNAQKSTGPISAYGRSMSKRNALKHGLLARTVLARGQQVSEPVNEFKKLCAEFYASLTPAGPLEEMLVDEIVQASWRLRRARLAESGEVVLSVDEGWWKRKNHNPLPLALLQAKSPLTMGMIPELERSTAGCSYLSYCLRKMRRTVETNGELTEAALADFKQSVGKEADAMVSKLAAIIAKGPGRTGNKTKEEVSKTASPTSQATEEIRMAHKAEVLGLIENETERLLYREEECEAREESEERARLSAARLPGAAVLDRISRYERGLERQLYQAMDRLERLQRRHRRQVARVECPVVSNAELEAEASGLEVKG